MRVLMIIILSLIAPILSHSFNDKVNSPIFSKTISSNSFSEIEAKLFKNITNDPTTIKFEFVFFDLENITKKNSSINIFDKSYILYDKRIEVRDKNNFSVFYKIKGVEGHFILTVLNEDIISNILIENQYYEIKTIGNNKQILRMYDQSKYPQACVFDQSKLKVNNSENESKTEDNSIHIKLKNTKKSNQISGNIECNLRLLIAYTPAFKTSIGNADNFCQLAVDLLNQTFINSSVNHRAELALSHEINYIEKDNISKDLDSFSTINDGVMDEVASWRNQVNADICILITTSTSGGALCGQARAIYGNRDSVFCVINYNCAISNISFPHEIGHLLGARHNNDSKTTPFANGHGFESSINKWRTIMAVASLSTRLPFWSNPNIQRNGVAMGTTAINNNATVLNTTIVDAKVFRQPNSSLTISSSPSIENNNIVDYNAIDNISSAQSYPSGVNVSYRAGVSITLSAGFRSGSVFSAQIVPIANCTGNPYAGGVSNGGDDITPNDNKSIIPINNSEFSVYPNPTNGIFNIEYNLIEAMRISLSIVDINGKEVISIFKDKNETNQHYKLQIEINQFADGVYFIKHSRNKEVVIPN